MSKLNLDFQWVDPQGAKVPEFRATWAELSISVGDVSITRLYDDRLRSIRDGIFLPLYPLAEWIVFHWWNLLYESAASGRSVQESYAFRHSIRYAREGYALPDVSISPLGDEVEIVWRPINLPAYRVDFIAAEGSKRLSREELEGTLRLLIESVLERLHQFGIDDSPLEQEWQAIESATDDERQFCRAAASLGLDPYDLSDDVRDSILRSDEIVPSGIADEFFQAADYLRIVEQLHGLNGALTLLDSCTVAIPQLVDLRRQTQMWNIHEGAPWQQGYEAARSLRAFLHADEIVIDSSQALAQVFGLNDVGDLASITREADSHRLFDVLIAVNRAGSPSFAIDKKQESAKRFALCRGLFEFLSTQNGDTLLVTRSQSGRQQRNRAFAAEFLAPSALIKERIGGDIVDREELEDVALEFGVSSLIIEHQVVNHRIARQVVD